MREFFLRLLPLICLAVLPGSLAVAVADDASLDQLEEQAFREAVALADASIVRIETVGGLDRVGQMLTSTGPTTGVVISPDGLIISSAFNFISQPTSILVQLADGRRFNATRVATDHSRMLTLLKIEATELPVPAAADPKEVKVGQWAIAAGRTYDLTVPNVSVGIVSALNRIWGKAIQTDAKISPFNYGGPLLNIDGKVMGILVPLSPQKSGETAGVEWYDSGIGFAIPMQEVLAAAERMKEGDDLHPGLLGLTLQGSGLLAGTPVIDRVRVESPADRAGVKEKDVIVAVDGQPVTRQAHVRHILGPKYAGDVLQLTLKRGDEELKVDITLVDKLTPWESGFLGILPVRRAVVGSEAPQGIEVRHVFDDSPAAKAGLKTRDLITGFNGSPVTTAAELVNLVSRMRPEEEASVEYQRDGKSETLQLTLATVPDDVPADLRSFPIPAGKSAKPAADAPAANAPDEDAPPAADKEDAEAGTGRITGTLPGDTHRYWGYVPESYNPDWPWGLVVWLHPENDTMEAAIFKQWKSLCDRRGLILIAPQSEEISGWNLNEAGFVTDLVRSMQERYTIDPARVVLHSFSSGGNFAYHLAFKERELFRGVAVAAQPLLTPPPENDPDFRQQMYLCCGDQDLLLKRVEATASGLRKLKYPCAFRTLTGRSHEYPVADDTAEIARWIDLLDRI